MMGNPVRVLHVLDKVHYSSGVSSVVMDYTRHIDCNRYAFDFAVHKECSENLLKEIQSLGGNVYHLPDITINGFRSFRDGFKEVLGRYPYKIVHGHVANSAFLYMTEAKRQNVCHRIIHAHNPYGADLLARRVRNRILDFRITDWANCYIACSQESAEYLFRKRAREAIILPNGIDTDHFAYHAYDRDCIRKEWGVSNNVICIGHVGRFEKQKNHKFLLEVFALIRKENPRCLLMLVGEGTLAGKVRQQAMRLGIMEHIRFLGTRNDMNRVYQGFDLFLLPSAFEGWGLVAAEAQAAGLPCLITDQAPQEVVYSENASRIPIRDAALWASLALSIMRKEDTIQEDRVCKAERSNLDIVAVTRKLMDIYDDLMIT